MTFIIFFENRYEWKTLALAEVKHAVKFLRGVGFLQLNVTTNLKN